MGWLRGSAIAAKGIHRAASSAVDAASLSSARAALRPSRLARRSGVLAPGDSPPTGLGTSFLDYRGAALPAELRGLSSGLVPIGSLAHPQAGPQSPGWLAWPQLVRHTAVIGPPGSGKTTRLLVPWMVAALRAGVAVVAVDVKGDLVEQISAAAGGKIGRPLYRWDIAAPEKSRNWNPLAEISDAQSLTAVVTALLDEIDTTSRERYFAERDHRWLRGLLRLVIADLSSATLADVLHMVLDRRRLDACVTRQPAAAREIGDLVALADSEFGLATGGLANKLAWAAEKPAASITSKSAFSLADTTSHPSLCVVGSRLSHGEPAAAAAATMLGLLRTKTFDRFGQQAHPVLWVIDEAAVLASRIELPRLLELARGANVGIVLALQDVTQLGDRDARVRQLASCHNIIALRGCSAETADYLASRLGSHGVTAATSTSNERGRWMPGISREVVPVLGSREIMHPPLGEFGGVAHVPSASAKPFLVDLG